MIAYTRTQYDETCSGAATTQCMLITYQQDPIPNVCKQNVHLFISMTGTRKRCLEANIEASITERTVPGARHQAGNRGVKVKVNVNVNINAS